MFNKDCDTELESSDDDCSAYTSDLTRVMEPDSSILFGWFDEFIYEIKFEPDTEVLSTNLSAINKGLDVYPNPTKGIVNLKGFKKDTLLKVFNYLGEQVYQLKTNNSILDFTYFKTGVYFVTQENLVLKVVKY